MKKFLLFAFVFLFLQGLQSFCQTSSDTIVVRKKIGTIFLKNGEGLTPNKMLQIMKPYPEAYDKMVKAKSYLPIANIFGVAGGFMFGWPIGGALAGGEMNWPVFGGGCLLIVTSIPFTALYTKEAKEAVRIYNEQVKAK